MSGNRPPRTRRPQPKRFDRNLVVIGAGAAGLVTAYIAATVNARVSLIEERRMGGDCLNFGCVPSKALLRSARLAHEARHAGAYGLVAVRLDVDFAQVMERVQRVIRSIEPHDSIERYTGLGVDVVIGRARIVSPWEVEVNSDAGVRTLTTRAIVVATGSEPALPALPGLEAVGCLTSDTVWSLRELPRRLLVLGGGPIGCELAQAFARLGAEVTLVEAGERILAKEDDEAAAVVARSLQDDGIAVLASHEAVRCEQPGGDKRLVVRHAGAERTIGFDALLCAVGRTPRTRGFGLEELGIEIGKNGTVAVDAALRTSVPSILACGDVAGPYPFTHMAAHQAWYAAVNALFGMFRRFEVDYRVVPWATFTDPEVARVGLSEAQARAQGIACEVSRFALAELDRALTDEAPRGFVKVLTVPGKDRILGVTIVGERAGELIAEYVLAMRHGIGLSGIFATIHVYPTLTEANKYASGAWKRSHAPARLLALARLFHRWRRHGGGEAGA